MRDFISQRTGQRIGNGTRRVVFPKMSYLGQKPKLGLEMILHAKDNGVSFGWIGMDSFYGEQPWLRTEIAAEKLIYIADIPVNTIVWLDKPETGYQREKEITDAFQRKRGCLKVNRIRSR
jgi:SRSO17 transposase